MRSIIPLTAFALITLSTPATAQMMCGAGQQAQASSSGAMMCGAGQAADDPMADKPTQQQRAGMMCPCCRNMAMMRGGTGGGMMQHQNMPGMDMPKQ